MNLAKRQVWANKQNGSEVANETNKQFAVEVEDNMWSSKDATNTHAVKEEEQQLVLKQEEEEEEEEEALPSKKFLANPVPEYKEVEVIE